MSGPDNVCVSELCSQCNGFMFELEEVQGEVGEDQAPEAPSISLRCSAKRCGEAHGALAVLSDAIGDPCLVIRDGEDTTAGALVRYVIEQYIQSDESWRASHGLPPGELGKLRVAYGAAIMRLKQLGEKSVPLE